ncbi:MULTISPECIES: hypothetical protein [Rhodomicrobium]|uniref:hypothetical protein n=1 Tax=Rhodomicrobium TaxID=1068 RepID=UPI000B4B30C1|nr:MULTISPECIES: hypothetical protein [Rhodomicrobium]
MKSLTYIEIEVPEFAGSSPEELVRLRFSEPTDYLPAEIDAIASIKSVSYTPSKVSLGVDLGQRATLQISFTDHRHIFAGEPFESGTFWGKWRARYGQRLRGYPVRWIQGLLGQALDQMEVRHFVIESTDGPTPQGIYTITAKDVLKLADGDRAQAPLASNGFIIANLDTDDTAVSLSPTGVGNLEYPASGHVAIGGKEICAFTRSGDALTLTRGQLGTLAASHEAGDRAQLVLRYTGEDPADIIRDLLVNYAGVPDAYIPITAWRTETESFLQRLYTTVIAEPTSVNTLVSELVQQAALAIWWEPLSQQIRLQVLRAIATTADRFTEDNTLEGSLSIKDQPGSRVSQIWTYFGLRNPLEPIDQADNYRSIAVTADLEAETAYGTSVIKKIFSRWIPFGGRQVALRLNDIQLGRFRDPPRLFSFSLFRRGPENPVLGGGYRLEAWPLQTVTGLAADAPIQITQLNPMADRYQIEAEEALFQTFTPGDLVNRVIIIDSNINNVNLRDIHDSIYPDPTGEESPAVTLTVYIEAGVIVGSNSTGAPAFNVGTWPVGIDITVYLRGRIQGRGGDGGFVTENFGGPGGNGGPALFTRFPIDLILNEGTGQIWGGGGGGGGADSPGDGGAGGGGGGGAGQLPGLGNPGDRPPDTQAQNGTTEAGGFRGGGNRNRTGGNGGGPGQAGGNANGANFGVGGAAGPAIDGLSFITKTGAGDIRGSQIN